MMSLRHGRSTTIRWNIPAFSNLVLFLLSCLQVSCAQDVSSAPATTPASLPTRTAMTFTDTTLQASIPISSGTILLISATRSNSTSSTMTLPTHDVPTELFPAATDPDGHPLTSNVFNYYFLFLVIFAVLIAVALWWIRRRKQRRKAQMRLSGQNALARDLEGFSVTRRFMHGRYGRYNVSAQVRRQEGLDERGEAPPPYQPKSDYNVTQAPAESGDGVEIPLRTLPRDPVDRTRPPTYH